MKKYVSASEDANLKKLSHRALNIIGDAIEAVEDVMVEVPNNTTSNKDLYETLEDVYGKLEDCEKVIDSVRRELK